MATVLSNKYLQESSTHSLVENAIGFLSKMAKVEVGGSPTD